MAEKVDLVKVQKDGFVIEIHPSTAEAHRLAGWTPAAADAKVTPIEDVPGFVKAEEAEEEAQPSKKAAK
jgi:hypothetical protein